MNTDSSIIYTQSGGSLSIHQPLTRVNTTWVVCAQNRGLFSYDQGCNCGTCHNMNETMMTYAEQLVMKGWI